MMPASGTPRSRAARGGELERKVNGTESSDGAVVVATGGAARERILARGRSEKSLARFDRIALVLSGGGALGAYQAGAYAALENCGVRPNWIAGTAIGAINAAIIAGNLPHERVFAAAPVLAGTEPARRGTRRRAGPAQGPPLAGRAPARPARCRARPPEPRATAAVSAGELRELMQATVDFDRVNSGAVRLVLGAVNLATGAETYFDNDRHVLGPEHVLASTRAAGLAAGRRSTASALAARRCRSRRSTMPGRPIRCAS